MLSLRRFLAFILDCILLLLPFFCLFVAVFLEWIDWNPEKELAFWLLVALYFGLGERFAPNQTPGKQWLNIRVVTRSGDALSAYNSFCRICLLLCAPVVANLLSLLLRMVVELDAREQLFATLLPQFFALLIFPVSIVMGGGEVGLHDLIANTVVRRSSQPATPCSPAPSSRFVVKAVLATLALSVALTLLLEVTTFGKLAELLRTKEAKRFLAAVKQAEEPLMRIDHATEYCTGQLSAETFQWQGDVRHELSFDRSPVRPPVNLKRLKDKFKLLLALRLRVTAQGLFSSTFQEAAASALATSVYDPTVVIKLTFVHFKTIGFIGFAVTKDLIAVPFQDEKGTARYFLAEPDGFLRAEIFFGATDDVLTFK